MSLYQGVAEGLFDIFYLTSVIVMGVLVLRGQKSELVDQSSDALCAMKLFGSMAIILGLGDSFHLIPRVYGLLVTGLDANYLALNMGKMITSVTMTAFYLILYRFYLLRYRGGKGGGFTVVMYLSALIRVILSLLPHNQWGAMYPSVEWGIYRNIPFAIMGVVVIYLFAREKYTNQDPFRWAWLAVTLSFLFYIPVVLFAQEYPIVGILMIPKTLAYLWLVRMGYNLHRQRGLSS